MENILLDNVKSSQSLISLESDYFHLFNLTAQKNVCDDCYGTVLNIKNTGFFIDTCNLLSNNGF